MLGLFRDVMGLRVVHVEDQFVVLHTANGDTVEVFGEKRGETHFFQKFIMRQYPSSCLLDLLITACKLRQNRLTLAFEWLIH